MRTTNKKLHH